MPLRKILSSLRLCLTFPCSRPTSSTVSPSWLIVSLNTHTRVFTGLKEYEYARLHVPPVMRVDLADPLQRLGVVVVVPRVHGVQPGGEVRHGQVAVVGGHLHTASLSISSVPYLEGLLTTARATDSEKSQMRSTAPSTTGRVQHAPPPSRPRPRLKVSVKKS